MRFEGPMLDAGPLLTALERANLGKLCDRDRKAVERARKRGAFTLFVADRICCTHLRTHPSLVWGAAYYSAGSAE